MFHRKQSLGAPGLVISVNETMNRILFYIRVNWDLFVPFYETVKSQLICY